MFKKLFFLLFLLSVLLSRNSSATNFDLCRLYGLLKNYTEIKPDSLDILTYNFLRSDIKRNANSYLDYLNLEHHLRGNPKEYEVADFSSSINPNNRSTILDLGWIDSIGLSVENKSKLLNILISRKSRKNKNYKKFDEGFKYLENNIKFDKVDSSSSMLTLYKAWNVINYFYPYKRILDTNWDDVFSYCEKSFYTASSKADLIEAVRFFSHYIDDDHVAVSDKNAKDNRLAIRCDYIDSTLTVSWIFFQNYSPDPNPDLKLGDTIVKINGITIDSIHAYFILHTGMSRPENERANFFKFLLFDFCTDSLVKVERNDGKTITIRNLEDKEWNKEYSNSQEQNFKTTNYTFDIPEMPDSIGYVNLPNTRYFKLGRKYRKVKHKPYLIIDCRGYGSLAMFKMMKRMDNRGHDVALVTKIDMKNPGVFKEGVKITYFSRNIVGLIARLLLGINNKGWYPTMRKTYNGEVFILINKVPMSFGETQIMALKAYRSEATLVGTNTRGANGNVSYVLLPFDIQLNFTGIRFDYPDGELLQRVGIAPDIYVDVKNSNIGDDAYIQKVLDVIHQMDY